MTKAQCDKRDTLAEARRRFVDYLHTGTEL